MRFLKLRLKQMSLIKYIYINISYLNNVQSARGTLPAVFEPSLYAKASLLWQY